jgi:hypothetical protein
MKMGLLEQMGMVRKAELEQPASVIPVTYEITVRIDLEGKVYVTEGDVAELLIDGVDSLCTTSLITGWAMDSRKPVSLLEFATAMEQARVGYLMELYHDQDLEALKNMRYKV